MICLWSQSCMGQAKDRAQACDSSCSFMHTSLPAGPQGHWDSSMAFLATAYLAHFYQSSVDPDLKFILLAPSCCRAPARWRPSPGWVSGVLTCKSPKQPVHQPWGNMSSGAPVTGMIWALETLQLAWLADPSEPQSLQLLPHLPLAALVPAHQHAAACSVPLCAHSAPQTA